MDDVDQIQDLVILRTERAIQSARSCLAADGEADCTDCGNPIAAARRQAYPAARRCIVCQGRSEAHTSELQSLMRISYSVFCLTTKIQSRTNKPTTITLTEH